MCLALFAAAQGPITPRKQPAPAERRNEPPDLPVAEIIQKFAANESAFREARGEYTYTQTVQVREFDSYGTAGGEFAMKSDVVFTPEGKRYEKIIYAPPSTLKLVSISPEDLRDLENIQPFVLTTEELPKYVVEYAGREQVDEISTYVFTVRPKRLEKGERYFQGTIWVDDQDLQIVKSHGKAVPDVRRGDSENLFPTFETYREQIDGKYWFPTLTRGDDVLGFKTGDVRIRMSVRYQNYKRFGSTIRIIPVDSPDKPPEQQ